MARLSFSDRLLRWYDQFGRHDLPWQQQRSPYRVWLAEIMLQQTQVATVIPYYLRFMQAFPDVGSLATAPLERVLELWSGLGYYSRARNLHKAARVIDAEFDGEFPNNIDQVMALPGIGQSTAGAILAQARQQRHAILDGNVKRVLCRYHAVEGWPSKAAVQKQLWRYAEQHTPEERVDDYTQAIMDLGATVCTRSSPRCQQCPLQIDCIAYGRNHVKRYPSPRPRKALPIKAVRFLILTDRATGRIMLEKRPPSGIWGGLWSLPEADLDDDIQRLCQQRWDMKVLGNQDQRAFRHSFSHYHLDITPCRVQVQAIGSAVNDQGEVTWCCSQDAVQRALATPVARIIREHA